MSLGINLQKFASILRGKMATTHGLSEIYKPTVTRSKENIMELIRKRAEETSKFELAKKARAAKGFFTLEMVPPSSMDEFKGMKTDLKLVMQFLKNGSFYRLTVKQAWLLFLVCLEVSLWFFLGETIGKFHIVGYKV